MSKVGGILNINKEDVPLNNSDICIPIKFLDEIIHKARLHFRNICISLLKFSKIFHSMYNKKVSTNNVFQMDTSSRYLNVHIYEHMENMSVLSHWWFTEYAGDIAEALRKKENQRINFMYQSPQKIYRDYLVDLIRHIGEQKSLCNSAVHLAVYLLDVFMDNHSIAVERLNLVALVSLLIATKFEDKDSRVPKVSELNNAINNQYPTNDYLSLEIMMLQFLQWNLVLPTAAHFVEYFVEVVVTTNDLEEMVQNQVFNNYEEFQMCAKHMVYEFLDNTLMDIRMVQAKPSQVAAACIGAARQYLHLEKKWTPSLKIITTYSLEDIQLLINQFLSIKSPKKRKFISSPNADSGYISIESSPEFTPKRRSRQSSNDSI